MASLAMLLTSRLSWPSPSSAGAMRYGGRALDALLLADLMLLTGLPLWLTSDSHLVRLLPQVDWFDPREPFAPYFLLYLLLSLLLAATITAALIIVIRFGTGPR